jgi:putative ABC transport system substrate-binding protein
MKRRTFVMASAALLTSPAIARARRLGVPRVGLLMGPTVEGAISVVQSFRKGLKERGYVEGQNIEILSRYAEGRMERLTDLATELVQLDVDVIVTGSNQFVLAALRATTSVPIVFVYAVDPVGVGLVASLARPGGKVTGLTSDASPEFWAKFLSILKEVVPQLSKVGVLGAMSAKVGFAELTEASQNKISHCNWPISDELKILGPLSRP